MKNEKKTLNFVNNMGIGAKLSLAMGVLLIIGFLTLGIVAGRISYKQSIELNMENQEAENKVISEEIVQRFYTYNQALVDLENGIHRIMENGDANKRQQVIDLVEDLAISNKYTSGIGIAFEKNAFDGRDKDFVDKQSSNEEGRFLPYSYQHEGKVTNIVLEDVNGKAWYENSKASGKIELIEPYRDEDDSLVSTISRPIYNKDGSLMGIMILDFLVGQLQEQMASLSSPEHYYAILTQEGHFVAHGAKEDLLLKNLKEIDPEADKLIQVVKDGADYHGWAKSAMSGHESLKIYEPVNFPDLDAKWAVISVTDKDTFMGPTKNMIYSIGIITLLMLALIIGVASYLMKKMVVSPVVEVSKVIRRQSEYNFTIDEETVKKQRTIEKEMMKSE